MDTMQIALSDSLRSVHLFHFWFSNSTMGCNTMSLMLFNSQVSFKQSASERDQGMLLLIKKSCWKWNPVNTLLKLRPVESFSLGRSSCNWASRISTSCSMSLMVELMSPAKMAPLVCLASSFARLAAFSPLRIWEITQINLTAWFWKISFCIYEPLDSHYDIIMLIQQQPPRAITAIIRNW